MIEGNLRLITPEWPAPAGVRAASTLRTGGISHPPYDSFNLALHVGDEPAHVAENRRRLRTELKLPAEPFWLEQVHGDRVLRVSDQSTDRQADVSVTDESGRVCVVMTADCLPVLFTTRDGDRVAAAHAGWRGLAGGVLEATLAALASPPREIMAWLGPAIGPKAFEVGTEVREAFVKADPQAASAFTANDRGRWQADLYALAYQRLSRAGVPAIYGGGYCTHREKATFFSHRRDGRSGRMATLIWIQPDG